MGVPLSCGPVLVWFPVAGSIDLTFGLGNQDIYVVDVVPAMERHWRWGYFLPVGLEPRLDLVGIEPQEPSEFEIWDGALLGPSIQRRTLDLKALRQCGDIQVLLHRYVYNPS